MELPKNITQIGETNQRCKIYVEDYVISYMKQLNKVACDKDMAVALYGVRKEESETSYLFLYGACKLTFLQRETRHLSQAQQQEIERERTRYFPEYTFLGYRVLNGEMIEGFHVCEQGICRYISGYAQFYEKNDNMLAYMLDVREEIQPETVEQEKYEVVKKKQEERRSQYEEKTIPRKKYQNTVSSDNASGLRGMKVAVVALFAVLCMLGITSLNGSGDTDNLQVMARQVMNDIMAQKLPDAESAGGEETPLQVKTSEEDTPQEEMQQETNQEVSTLVTEDKLTEALLQENRATVPAENATSDLPAENGTPDLLSENGVPDLPAGNEVPDAIATNAASASIVAPEPTSYIIKEGDTLIGISVRNYGSDTRVADICKLNQIKNPDDIRVGQKILLP